MWKDPSQPDPEKPLEDTTQQSQSLTSSSGGAPQMPMGGSLPPMSSYGAPGPTWNKETMSLLVDIEIPMQYLQNGRNRQLFVWFKQALMQLQFGNFTGADQRNMIKSLRYILFLSQQEGNEQIVFEEQLLFVSNLMISKGRSDKPDGLRERTAWIMQIAKSIFKDENAQRPNENKSTWNLPFVGGR